MGTLERNMKNLIEHMNTRNDKVVEMIEDKIREAENYEEFEYSEDYIKGYISGLKHAKTIAKEILY